VLGRPVRRKHLRRVKSIGVLAGNYSGIDDDTAQKTLKWIKRYDPKCLRDGVVYVPRADVKTPAGVRQTPLAAAFLTINPLLNPEEVMSRNIDPLLVRLNHGERYSLLDNKGKYTLIVASFAGKVKAVSADDEGLRGSERSGGLANFLKDNDLDDAAQQAQKLALALRQAEHVDAFVWHDRCESFVTVGQFSSENDPGLAAMRARFGSDKPIQLLVPADVVAAPSSGLKYLAVDGAGHKIDPNATDPTRASNYQIWAFDPNPRPMRVPRVR